MLAFLPSLSLSVFSSKAEPAPSLLLLQKLRTALLQLQCSSLYVYSTVSTRSEVLNTQVKPEEALIFSGLVCSESHERTKKRLSCPYCFPSSGQWMCKMSLPLTFPVLLCPGLVPHGGW